VSIAGRLPVPRSSRRSVGPLEDHVMSFEYGFMFLVTLFEVVLRSSG
jgi:hypothetical protein